MIAVLWLTADLSAKYIISLLYVDLESTVSGAQDDVVIVISPHMCR